MNYRNKINIGLTKKESNGVVYYTAASLVPYVDFAFCGEISNNLSFKAIRSTSKEDMQHGYMTLCNAINIPYEKTIMTNIVHGNEVTVVDDTHAGMGVSSSVKLPPCDGLITDTLGLPIASTHADCMPIAYYDKGNNVGCVIHAGWRGVLARIHEQGMEMLIKKYNSKAEDIIVVVGPTINQCCFQVDLDVSADFVREFGNDDFVAHHGEKDRLDLTSIVLKSFEAFRIPPENVTVDGRCTACIGSGLASYRRDKDKAGTMAQIMCLR